MTFFRHKRKDRGFTLVELLIVMAVVSILVAVIIPSFRGMQQEGWLTKAEGEVKTLQTAVESYYRHQGAYPSNIGSSLTNAQPQIIAKPLNDPWNTASVSWNGTTYEGTYGYVTGNDPAGFGEWYIIYSVGIDYVKNCTYNAVTNQVEKIDPALPADTAASNAPLDF